jgi:hypothetical protein
MQNTCAECDRLWAEYTQAAKAHLTVVVRRHKAAIQSAAIHKTAGVLDEIAQLEYDLAQQKLKARRAISEHEAEHEIV